jgi:hypothetical protein
MFLFSNSRRAMGIILAIILTGIPIYYYVTTMIQAPWGKADIDMSIKDMIHSVEKTSPSLPKIVLGDRLRSHNSMHGSAWSGFFDYEATVGGAPTRLRISWEELIGINTITKIEGLSDDSPSSTIWSRSNNAPSR